MREFVRALRLPYGRSSEELIRRADVALSIAKLKIREEHAHV